MTIRAGALALIRLQQLHATRDPVAKAQASQSAKRKKAVRKTADGLALHSFSSLLRALGTLCRHRCSFPHGAGGEPTLTKLTEPNKLQRKAFELLGIKGVYPVGCK